MKIPVAALNKNPDGKNKGFTLIELIIYVAFVGIFLTGAIMFLWDVIYSKERVMEENAQIYTGMAFIGKGIYLANTSTTLQEFSDNLDLEVVTTDKSADNSINGQAQLLDFRSSWEIQKPDLESGSLLMNLTEASLLSTGDELVGISLKNSSDSNSITIDKVYAEWQNVTDTVNITEIQIDGGDSEWSGSSGNETTVDITDFSLSPNESVPVDYLRFDKDLSGGYLIIKLIMADGSHIRGEFDLMTQEGIGGTGPTPCSEWCIDNSYDYGTCEQNAQQCIGAGGTHEPDADYLCEGGSDADTCCCMP